MSAPSPPAVSAASAPSALVLRARRAPRSRAGVREISAAAPAGELFLALDEALARHDDRAAGTLALALAVLGEDIGRARLEALAPDLEDARELVALLAAQGGDRLALVARLLDLEVLSEDREAVLVALAVHRLGWTSPPDDAWRVRMRRLGRRAPTEARDRALLGAALAGAGVPAAEALGEELVAEWKKDGTALAEAIGWLETPVLELLPDAEVARVVATVTVRHAEAKVGRNDPCPCGSGKKFKKCHGEAAAGGTGPAAPQEASVDAAGLVPSDVKYLRLPEIAALDLGRVRSDSLEEAFRRALDFRRWALAERIAAEIDARPQKPAPAPKAKKGAPKAAAEGPAPSVPTARHDLVLSAVDARRWDVVERLLAGAPDADVPEAVRLQRASTAAQLAPLEAVARTTLDAPGPLALDLVFALLDHWPALGILCARGLIAVVDPRDAPTLVSEIERARDVLDVPPVDAAEDLVDALDEARGAWAEVEDVKVRAQADRDALATAAARAAEELAKKAAELTTVAMRLRDAEDEIARLHAAERARTAGAAAVGGLAEEERRRLGARIEELKSLVTDGNRERAELRAEITALTSSAGSARVAAPASAREEADDDQDASADEATAPRGVLVPIFSRAALASLGTHPARIRKAAIETAAGLAVGDPIAWRGSKPMEGVERVWSARLGIHNRLLFRLHDAELEVLDVVTREDLLKTLERWR